MPDVARGVFSSERLPLVERYVEWLGRAGVERGLIGPREAPRLWERHVINCALPAADVPEGAAVCDVGSGAGLPGLVWAIIRPDLQVTLVEPLLRRTTFLSEVTDELGLANVEVVRGRAEEQHGRLEFDLVTSRAVAPLGRLVTWCLPLARADGTVWAMKGSSAPDEVARDADALRSAGAGRPEIVDLHDRSGQVHATVVRIPWHDPQRVPLLGQRGAAVPGGSGVRPKAAAKRKSRRHT